MGLQKAWGTFCRRGRLTRMRALAFLTILAAAAAQTPDAAQFEVASVRIAPPPDGRGMRVSIRGGPGSPDPTLFTCENCGLSGLIMQAFDLQEYQLSGPSWLLAMGMDSARFMVSAKIPAGTTKEQFRLMLQNLLAERFQMTFHRDKKEMTILNLVVAKNGPKFKESKPVEAADEDRPGPPGPPKKDADGFPILPAGKGQRMAIMNGRAAMRSEESIAQLAQMLANQLHQAVIDATGLSGKYEIGLTWVPGDAPDNPGPTIFAALQEQLGLKLESKKGMVEILVVDHVEKTPTEN